MEVPVVQLFIQKIQIWIQVTEKESLIIEHIDIMQLFQYTFVKLYYILITLFWNYNSLTYITELIYTTKQYIHVLCHHNGQY